MIRISQAFLITILLYGTSFAGAAGGWFENFDDQYLKDSFDAITGSMGTGTYNASFVDRPGNGKVYQFDSNNPEVIPVFFSLVNNFGLRWKFDLWIGPKTGSSKHTARRLKFIHRGSDPNHVIYLRELTPSDSRLRKTDLNTGEEMPSMATDVAGQNLHFMIMDPDSGFNKNLNNTNLDQFRGQWVTVEFEITCGNPSSTKIWVNGALDFYRVSSGGSGLWPNCWSNQMHFVNYNLSASGDVYLAIDNFYKYDSLKTEDSHKPSIPVIGSIN